MKVIHESHPRKSSKKVIHESHPLKSSMKVIHDSQIATVSHFWLVEWLVSEILFLSEPSEPYAKFLAGIAGVMD